MSRRTWTAGSTLVLTVATVGAFLLTGAKGGDAATIEWRSELAEAHREARSSNRPMLIVVEAEWCRYCGKLQQQTLADPKVANYVSKAFVPVHLDYDRDRDLARILEVKSLPCTIVLSPEADLLGRLVGYVEAETFHESLVAAHNLQDRVQQIRHEEPQGK